MSSFLTQAKLGQKPRRCERGLLHDKTSRQRRDAAAAATALQTFRHRMTQFAAPVNNPPDRSDECDYQRRNIVNEMPLHDYIFSGDSLSLYGGVVCW